MSKEELIEKELTEYARKIKDHCKNHSCTECPFHFVEWKHGLITDEEYADEYRIDKMHESRLGAVEDEEEADESEDGSENE